MERSLGLSASESSVSQSKSPSIKSGTTDILFPGNCQLGAVLLIAYDLRKANITTSLVLPTA